jgi:hypothetical protein
LQALAAEHTSYRKMIKQIDKYWEKLFAKQIQVGTPAGKIIIQPQRTNNLMEQIFRFLKCGKRRKSGLHSLNEVLVGMFADTLLVRNLNNSDYTAILLKGAASLAERLAEIDVEEVLKEEQKNKALFGIVILLIFISTAVNYNYLSNIKSSQSEVVKVRYAIVMAGKDLINGINQSLATLRGYMILGGEPAAQTKFKLERKAAWQDINKAVKFLGSLTASMDAHSIENIDKINSILSVIADNQQAIEHIAQTRTDVRAFGSDDRN